MRILNCSSERVARVALSAVFLFALSTRLMAQGAPIDGSANIRIAATPSGNNVQARITIDLTGVMGRSSTGAVTPAVLGAYQIRVTFDRNVLQLSDVGAGTSPGFNGAPTATNLSVANAQGNVLITHGQTNPDQPTGSVHVATLTFAFNSPGVTTIRVEPLSVSTALQGGAGPASVSAQGGFTTTDGSATGVCPSLSPSTLSVGTAGATYPSTTITMAGGSGPVTFSYDGDMPFGMNLSSDGVLSGTPEESGNFALTIFGRDASGCTSLWEYQLVIACPSAINVQPVVMPDATRDANYYLALSASGSTGTVHFTHKGNLPPGMSLASGVLSGKPTATGTYNFTVEGKDAHNCAGMRNYSLVVASPSAPPAPSNLNATAISSSQVSLSWGASSGASYYEVARLSAGGAFQIINGNVGGLTFTDATTSPSTGYVYRVRAIGAGGASPFSNADHAVTVVFSDDPIVPTQTPVRAAHVMQLRFAINALRSAAGLPQQSWTDPSLVPGATRIRAVHFTELRSALTAAYSALGRPAPVFTNTNLNLVTVRAAHSGELRAAVK